VPLRQPHYGRKRVARRAEGRARGVTRRFLQQAVSGKSRRSRFFDSRIRPGARTAAG
jgi:hypothetical protein